MPDERSPNLSAEPAPASPESADDGFAADLAGPTLDTSAAAPPEPAKSAFDPVKVDWHRAKPEEIPEAYRPVQTIIKSHLAAQTRAEQENATLRRRLETVETQRQTPQSEEKLVQALERIAPSPDRYRDLRERLSPEEAPAIDMVVEILRRELEAGPKLEPVQQEVAGLKQAVAYLVYHLQQQAVTSQAGSLQEVLGKYGEESVRAVAPTLRGLLQVPNPTTGRAYTLAEAADMLLGPGLAARQGGRAQVGVARADAQRRVAPTPTAPAGNGQPMTNEEVRAELRELGFK